MNRPRKWLRWQAKAFFHVHHCISTKQSQPLTCNGARYATFSFICMPYCTGALYSSRDQQYQKTCRVLGILRINIILVLIQEVLWGEHSWAADATHVGCGASTPHTVLCALSMDHPNARTSAAAQNRAECMRLRAYAEHSKCTY